MNQESASRLRDEHPLLYANTLAFDCEDGWFGLLQRLSDKVEAINQKEETPIVAVQVKEKFGGLRFYVNGHHAEAARAISDAEAESYTVCETCGSKGSLRKVGWWKTLCDDCCATREAATFHPTFT